MTTGTVRLAVLLAVIMLLLAPVAQAVTNTTDTAPPDGEQDTGPVAPDPEDPGDGGADEGAESDPPEEPTGETGEEQGVDSDPQEEPPGETGEETGADSDPQEEPTGETGEEPRAESEPQEEPTGEPGEEPRAESDPQEEPTGEPVPDENTGEPAPAPAGGGGGSLPEIDPAMQDPGTLPGNESMTNATAADEGIIPEYEEDAGILPATNTTSPGGTNETLNASEPTGFFDPAPDPDTDGTATGQWYSNWSVTDGDVPSLTCTNNTSSTVVDTADGDDGGTEGNETARSSEIYWYTFLVGESVSFGKFVEGDNIAEVPFEVDTNDPRVNYVEITVSDKKTGHEGHLSGSQTDMVLPLQVKGESSDSFETITHAGVKVIHTIHRDDAGIFIEPVYLNQRIPDLKDGLAGTYRIELQFRAAFV